MQFQIKISKLKRIKRNILHDLMPLESFSVNWPFNGEVMRHVVFVSVFNDTNSFGFPLSAWQPSVSRVVCTCLPKLWRSVLYSVVFLSSSYALWPLGGSGGQFMIWLWCYNTIGLQWCCSSSLTLLAPPTGPLLPTLLLLCLLGSAPPPPVAVRQCMGDPWGDGDHGSPFQNGQSPCVLHRRPFSLSVSHMCVCERRYWMRRAVDGDWWRSHASFHLFPGLWTS